MWEYAIFCELFAYKQDCLSQRCHDICRPISEIVFPLGTVALCKHFLLNFEYVTVSRPAHRTLARINYRAVVSLDVFLEQTS